MHLEDAVARLWPGEFHFIVKSSVPIPNQPISWTQELTQLEWETLQLQSEGNTGGCLQPMFPLTCITTAPFLHCEEGRHIQLFPTAVMLPGCIVPVYSQTHSVIQSRRISFSPVACTKQGQQWIQSRLLKVLSQLLEVIPGKLFSVAQSKTIHKTKGIQDFSPVCYHTLDVLQHYCNSLL